VEAICLPSSGEIEFGSILPGLNIYEVGFAKDVHDFRDFGEDLFSE
jgi:hypothetical protein